MNNDFGRPLQDGVSLISCCMDRNPHLEQTIHNWLQFEQIKEIVIVDWSSKTPLKPFIDSLNDPRIHLVRVDQEETFALAFPGNLAARYCTGNRILKMDADTMLAPNFFEENPLEHGVYYKGNLYEDRGLTGMLYVRREDLFAINGFNEYFTIYGWEDTDLFNRLLLVQDLEARYIKPKTSSHIAHDDSMRMAKMADLIGFHMYDPKEIVDETLDLISESCIKELGSTKQRRIQKLRTLIIPPGTTEADYLQSVCRHPVYNIMRNRHFCEEFPWGPGLEMSRYETIESSERYLRVFRSDEVRHLIPEDRMRAAKCYGLAKLFFFAHPSLQAATKELSYPMSANF